MKPIAVMAGAGCIGLAALIWWPQAEAPPAPLNPSGATQPPAAFAGAASAKARFFRELGNSEPEPATEIALTDDRQLIVDSALRDVMDFYLKEEREDRLPALTACLSRKLPTQAATDAIQLASRYQAYLKAYGQLLAAQNFRDVADLNRLESWQQQRRQLRERQLGETVAEAWFGTEDAYLTQALEELRNPPTGINPEHDQHMRQVLLHAAGLAAR
jgi:hypothetical protein